MDKSVSSIERCQLAMSIVEQLPRSPAYNATMNSLICLLKVSGHKTGSHMLQLLAKGIERKFGEEHRVFL